MAPLSLKIVSDNGAVTRTMKFDSTMKVKNVMAAVEAKMATPAGSGKEHGLFLTSTDDQLTGIWLEGHKNLDYYILKDGDMIHYLCRKRNLKIRMLDGSVKTMPVDQALPIKEIMFSICGRLGITNHDEYGLCRENEPKAEEKSSMSGTLTSKKAVPRERDSKLEQLSKILKTDDNVHWLEQHRTLRELQVDPEETVLLKRRLFFTDRKVDTRDPVQLNLLYVQTRDAILDGKHPVTSDQAVQFAGIQCQVQYGDYQEDKHKPGYIESLQEFLPQQYASSRSIEKKIFKQYQKHQGLESLEAKHLYIKTAREMPTYGVTFFLVKEKQKGMKKLVPRLLGISCDSILRLDEVTKEILQTWSLTQVKTFHVGVSETFSLDFGDYSDKQYVVKTNEGYRIRDTLQGYIDIISRRMVGGPYGATPVSGGVIAQEEVHAGQANVMEFVSNNPTKVVEESFVGPSRIITRDIGVTPSQGTHITTVHQLVVANRAGGSQQAVTGAVPMRGDMSKIFTKKLNSLNSNSVKIVTFLTSTSEPTEEDIQKAKDVIDTMYASKQDIIEGVKDAASKQTDVEARNKLLAELDELCDYLNKISNASHTKSFDIDDVVETSKNIADLSTQIYFALDARAKKRRDFVRTSRQSFIEDDKTQDQLHRASMKSAKSTMHKALAEAVEALNQAYRGPALNKHNVIQAEESAADKLRKLNAAVALMVAAYADPNNIDYIAAINSIHTVNELLPKLTNDMQAVGSVKDDAAKTDLANQLKRVLEALNDVTASTNDLGNLQEAASSYSEVSGKLVYTLGRGVNPGKHGEIVELAREAGDKTGALLVRAHDLVTRAGAHPAADAVEGAGMKCAGDARALLLAAQLTAPTIREPHCQSALTAAAESLSSSAQLLVGAVKPLADSPKHRTTVADCCARAADLDRSLDKLRSAYSDVGTSQLNVEEAMAADQIECLTVASAATTHALSSAKQIISQAYNDATPMKEKSKDVIRSEENSVADKLQKLNAAIAVLLTSHADSSNVDYASAASSLNKINEIVPSLAKDIQSLSSSKDAASKKLLLDQIEGLLNAVNKLTSCAGSKDIVHLQEVASEYGSLSSKLVYTIGRGVNPHKEDEIMELAREAGDKTGALLVRAHDLVAGAGAHPAVDAVEGAGVRCAGDARALLLAVQLTAPTIREPHCQSALTAAAESLSYSVQQLVDAAKPLADNPEHRAAVADCRARAADLDSSLGKLRSAYSDLNSKEVTAAGQRETLAVATATTAHALSSANEILSQAYNDATPKKVKSKDVIKDEEESVADKLRKLNAAVAVFLTSHADSSNIDYETAASSMANINELVPSLAKDTLSLSSSKDAASKKLLLDQIQGLLAAVNKLTSCAGSQDFAHLQELASGYGGLSGKLVYSIDRGVNPRKDDEIVELVREAGEKTGALLVRANELVARAGVHPAADAVEGAAVKCAGDARALLLASQLTAPTIREPHCQSTLTAAAESLSSSAQLLVGAAKPLADSPEHRTTVADCRTRAADLDRSLDKLRSAYSDLNVEEAMVADQKECLTVASAATTHALSSAKQIISQAYNDATPVKEKSKDVIRTEEDSVADKLQKLNAAIAVLLTSHADSSNIDYASTASSLNKINELVPSLAKDIQSLSSSKDAASKKLLLDQIQGLLNAVNKLTSCAGSKDIVHLQEVASEYGSLSSKLVYTIGRGVNPRKEDEIVELAREAGDKTGALLVRAHELVAGAEAHPAVDAVEGAGVRCAGDARALLLAVQLTAPTIREPHCQSALTAAAESLSSSAQQLVDAAKPLADSPENRAAVAECRARAADLDSSLGKLRSAYSDLNSKEVTAAGQRETLAVATATTAHALSSANQILSQAYNDTTPKKAKAKDVKDEEESVADKLRKLNAAVAVFLTSHADSSNIDYETAASSMANINELVPSLAKDTLSLSSSKDAASKKLLLDQIQGLLAAVNKLTSCAGSQDFAHLQELGSEYGGLSSKLVYSIGRGVNPRKDDEIVELVRQAGEKTGALLVRANELVAREGAHPAADAVEGAAVKCAGDARALLLAAQLTAPTIREPHCQSALTAAAESLSSSAQLLVGAAKPLADSPKHRTTVADCCARAADLDRSLDKLRSAYSDLNVEEAMAADQKECLTVASAATTHAFSSAKQIISQAYNDATPMKEKSKDVIRSEENSVADKLQKLNAAIAVLLTSHADSSNVDYASAASSLNKINEIVPSLAKDIQSLSSSKDAASKKLLLDQIEGLLNAVNKLTSCAGSKDIVHLQEVASEYGSLSSKLVYTIGRGVNPHKEDEIMELAREAGDKTGALLVRAHDLVAGAGAHPAVDAVEGAGVRCAGDARALLLAVQLTAPTIREPHCQSALTAAAESLSSSVQQLVDAAKPLADSPEHRAAVADCRARAADLDSSLGKLRSAYSDLNSKEVTAAGQRETLAVATATTAHALSSANEILSQAYNDATPKKVKSKDVIKDEEESVADKLRKLNAAVAVFLTSHADSSNIDYETAASSMANINELVPSLAKDTLSLSSSKDAASKKLLLDQIQGLLAAVNKLTSCAGSQDFAHLQELASGYGGLSGKLVYSIGRGVNPRKDDEIVELVREAGEKTGALLVRANELVARAGPHPAADAVEGAAVKCAGDARALLLAAQLTAPTIREPHCQSALTAAAESLSSSAQLLVGAAKPLADSPKHRTTVADCCARAADLDRSLDKLRSAYSDLNVEEAMAVDQRESLSVATTATDNALSSANQILSQAYNDLTPTEVKTRDALKAEEAVAEKLRKLNAAVAVYLSSTIDSSRIDYPTVVSSLDMISELLPVLSQKTRSLGSNKDEFSKRQLLDQLKDMFSLVEKVTHSAGSDPEKLQDMANEYSMMSSKLMYNLGRGSDRRKAKVVDLAREANIRTEAILKSSKELLQSASSHPVSGAVKEAEAHCVDKAKALLLTAQLTAPTIRELRCKRALKAAAENLLSSAQTLISAAKPLLDDPQRNHLFNQKQLPSDVFKLAEVLDQLCDSCSVAKDREEEMEDKLFKATKIAEENIMVAEKLLDEPQTQNKNLTSKESPALQDQLSSNLGRLNAAIAALLAATSDMSKWNHAVAEASIKTISELLPSVIKDTKTLNAEEDANSQKSTIRELKSLCEAFKGVNASARLEEDRESKLRDAIEKLSTATGKLYYTYSRRADPKKEQQTLHLARRSCEKALQLGEHRDRLASIVPDKMGVVDERFSVMADAAHGLLGTAQTTASSITETPCQQALTSSVETLSRSVTELSSVCIPLLLNQKSLGNNLKKDCQEIETELQKIRQLCVPLKKEPLQAPIKRAPPVPVRRTPATNTEEQREKQAPKRVSALTQEFLEHLQSEEEQEKVKQLAKQEAEKKNLEEFAKCIDVNNESILKIEEQLKKLHIGDVKSVPGSGVRAPLAAPPVVKKQLVQDLARAAVAASQLIACNHLEKIDYDTASKSANELSASIAEIAKGAETLCKNKDNQSRKALLESILALCNATRKLCSTAKRDRENLNDAALEFGDQSAKLLYTVSPEVDPVQEKEVITKARAIGDAASRVTLGGARLVPGADGSTEKESEGADVRALCSAGQECADAAGIFVYIAKIVAPLIQVASCQEVLTATSKDLSSKISTYTATWKPLSSDSNRAQSIKGLTAEAQQLENLLQDFRRDLIEGKLVKRREVEKLVAEDTPLRQLACKISEYAKNKAENPNLTGEEKRATLAYNKKLVDAIKAVDIANARCLNAPHDTNRRNALENAVQNLQTAVVMSRIQGTGGEHKVVDLADYVKDVSELAEQIIGISLKVNPKSRSKKPLESIRSDCHQINLNQFRLLSPLDQYTEQTALENIQEVESFEQDCRLKIKDMNTNLAMIDDEKIANELREMVMKLTEGCDHLKFATKSALATAESATFDETVYDLNNLENKLDKMLAPEDVPSVPEVSKPPAWPGVERARAALARSARVSGGAGAAPQLARYLAALRAAVDRTQPAERHRLKQHAGKLLLLLKTLVLTRSRRVVTWQAVDEGEAAAVTAQIMNELESYDRPDNKISTASKILSDEDVGRLLTLPKHIDTLEEKKYLEERLQQMATKLSFMTGTVTLCADKPQSLASSAHAAVETAQELAEVAMALGSGNPQHTSKLQDASQKMSFATYNFLKAAELVSQDSSNIGKRRRLQDACRELNEAINKLSRVAAPSDKIGRVCGEGARAVRAALGGCTAAREGAGFVRSADSYADCLEALTGHQGVLQNLQSDEQMSREEFSNNLSYVATAVSQSAEYAAQCVYLLSISDQHKDLAKEGVVDVPRIQKSTNEIQNACSEILLNIQEDQVKEEATKLTTLAQDLQQTIEANSGKIKDQIVKDQFALYGLQLEEAISSLNKLLREPKRNEEKITSATMSVMDAASALSGVAEQPSLVPSASYLSAQTQQRCDDITDNAKNLTNKVLTLIREVKLASDNEDDEMMTWVMFDSSKKNVLEAFERLIKSVKDNGQFAGLIEMQPPEESEEQIEKIRNSYLQIQLDLANKWLKRPNVKAEVKSTGVNAVRGVLDIAETMLDELKGSDKEEMQHLTKEVKQLLHECSAKYDHEKACLLMERLKELKKAIERTIVIMVVEDFMEETTPLQDLDTIVDAERDEARRKYILEQKIAELLAHLQKVKKTAHRVADTGTGGQELKKCSNQTELLAPLLVKAAHERVQSPDNKAVVENYKSILAKYAESLSKVRELCDLSVDPMEFVQTTGETIQRIKEEFCQQNDLKKCANTSLVITRLAGRAVQVGLCWSRERGRYEPEVAGALSAARLRLAALTPTQPSSGSVPDWSATTAEVLRATGEVESVLGGEMIFNKQPEPDQPIYNAALNLHATLREWSARDNDIVAAAKRMAVLMAKLSNFMNTDKKRDVISTSKSIVNASVEVAQLAKKLALECTDIRIRTNLLQVCETIPTISGQLKMLTTVKGSSLGQGTVEDKEAMDMLVGNAQNLMTSIQDVVKSAAAASVKIRSQLGGTRIRWVRKNY